MESAVSVGAPGLLPYVATPIHNLSFLAQHHVHTRQMAPNVSEEVHGMNMTLPFDLPKVDFKPFLNGLGLGGGSGSSGASSLYDPDLYPWAQ